MDHSINTEQYHDFEAHYTHNPSKEGCLSNKCMIRGIFCVSILTMLMMCVAIGLGSYAYVSGSETFKKASTLMGLVDENSVVSAVQYINRLDGFIKTLNITEGDVENGILTGLEVGRSVEDIPNISAFFHDISYLVDSACRLLPCNSEAKISYEKAFTNLIDTMRPMEQPQNS